MPTNPMSTVVTVESPPRGEAVQTPVSFRAAQCTITKSWGLQPATALIDWASAEAQPALIPNAAMTIEMGGHTFYGVVVSAVPVVGSDGFSLMQEFQDSRIFLMADTVACSFNMRVDKIVNGRFVKRYEHILPWDFNAGVRTYTNAPYTGREILDFLFNAPTVMAGWTRVYHTALDTAVYELDWLQGRKLGAAILEISEKLGLTFTLQGGRYTLLWALKGVGEVPAFPANSDRRRRGLALSGNPTRIRILGGRNVYQVLNIDMAPDWVAGWQFFYDFNAFVRDIFLNERTEAPFGSIAQGTRYSDIDESNENNAGYLLARARAQVITVEQYAALRDARDGSGNSFRDYRKFGGRSRLTLPAAVYLSQILFKAFRFPGGFYIRNVNGVGIGTNSFNVIERALVQVTHDPLTGQMSYVASGGFPVTPSQSSGYAIVKGYQVASDAFKTLKPEYFDINQWISTQGVWQAMPFHVDDSGEGDQFILFDDPVISSADVISQITFAGVQQRYPGLRADATVLSPAVRVALTFAAEPFSYWAGIRWIGDVGVKDEVANIPNLSGEYVCSTPTGGALELPYADGFRATQKAAAFAAPLLNQQYYYVYGGYVVQGSNATQLTPVIDRVTVRVDARGGLEEEVDFTTQRARNVSYVTVPGWGGRPVLVPMMQPEPDADFNRRATLMPLAPGQAELQYSANQLRAEAGFLLKHPKISRMLMDTFHLLLGQDAVSEAVMLNEGQGLLAIGTPLFREATGNNPWMPSDLGTVDLDKPVFVGVTTVHNEKGDGPVRVTRAGNGNIIFARVLGPVSVGDEVGYDSKAKTFLEHATGLTASVGNVLEDIASAVVKLIQVRVSGGGTGGGLNYRGTFDQTKTYKKNDIVRVKTGSDQGLYIAVRDVPVVSGNSEPPQFPEPADLLPPGINTWEVWSMGVQEIDACVANVNKTIYVNASEPF